MFNKMFTKLPVGCFTDILRMCYDYGRIRLAKDRGDGMRLTSFTEYSLRVLLYLGTRPKGQLSSIKEISSIYHISTNHLSKIVYELGKLGLIQTIRGRNGGIRLAKDPEEINIGWVVRQTEEDFHQAACFDESKQGCIISSACRLKSVLSEALNAYLNVLDSYSLQDLLVNQKTLQRLFEQTAQIPRKELTE